jgi:hypothetical protein
VYAVELPLDNGRTWWGQVDARTRQLVLLDDGVRRVAGTTVHGDEGPVELDVNTDPAGIVVGVAGEAARSLQRSIVEGRLICPPWLGSL